MQEFLGADHGAFRERLGPAQVAPAQGMQFASVHAGLTGARQLHVKTHIRHGEQSAHGLLGGRHDLARALVAPITLTPRATLMPIMSRSTACCKRCCSVLAD
jgi:hypothetical protein